MVTADTVPSTAKPLLETAAETNFGQRWLSQGLVAFISFTQTPNLCLFFWGFFLPLHHQAPWGSDPGLPWECPPSHALEQQEINAFPPWSPAHWLKGRASHRSQRSMFFPLGPLCSRTDASTGAGANIWNSCSEKRLSLHTQRKNSWRSFALSPWRGGGERACDLQLGQ